MNTPNNLTCAGLKTLVLRQFVSAVERIGQKKLSDDYPELNLVYVHAKEALTIADADKEPQ